MGGFLAVDWGTTNRRCFLVAEDGSVTARTEEPEGILSVADFPAEIAKLQSRAGGTPLLLAGMIGSNRGWIEVPYVTAPAGLDEIAAGVHHPAPGVFIVPGVLYADGLRPDVMRGEEVQLLGALAAGSIGDGLVCHPGTHSKWVDIEAGRIARFRTVMSGDMFAALKHKSILSDLLAHSTDDELAFVAGVDHGIENCDLMSELFTARARVLVGQLTPEQAAARISGLIVGTDVQLGLGRTRADLVPVLGDKVLTAKFALALARAGRETVILDGEKAFVAGARAIMARLH